MLNECKAAVDSCIALSCSITALVLSSLQLALWGSCVEQQSQKTSSSPTVINRIDVCDQDVWLYPAKLEKDHLASLGLYRRFDEIVFPLIFFLHPFITGCCNRAIKHKVVITTQKYSYEVSLVFIGVYSCLWPTIDVLTKENEMLNNILWMSDNRCSVAANSVIKFCTRTLSTFLLLLADKR